MPAFAGVARVVDTAAGRRDQVIGIPRIDVNGKDVRIVNYSLLDTTPGPAAIGAFERQIPGARVNDVRIARVNGQRFHVNQARRGRRGQRRPGFARIIRAKDPVEGAHNQDVWILLGLRQ